MFRKPIKYSYDATSLFSSTFFLFPTFDKPDLNWISDQYCLLEHDVMLEKSNHCAIVIMVLISGIS